MIQEKKDVSGSEGGGSESKEGGCESEEEEDNESEEQEEEEDDPDAMDTDEEDTGEIGMTHMSDIRLYKKTGFWITGMIEDGGKLAPSQSTVAAIYHESPKRLCNFLAKPEFKRYAGPVLKYLIKYKHQEGDALEDWKKITGDETLERLATEYKEEQAAKKLAAKFLGKVSRVCYDC